MGEVESKRVKRRTRVAARSDSSLLACDVHVNIWTKVDANAIAPMIVAQIGSCIVPIIGSIIRAMREPQFSFVHENAAAEIETARSHFKSKLTFETDAWDVKTDMERGRSDFVVIDVRSPADFEAKRIAGAISLPHRTMDAQSTAHLPKDKVMVTYCWHPGCNGSTKGALRLASLGFRVKELIGGLEYWIREGGPVEGTLVDEADRARELCGVS